MGKDNLKAGSLSAEQIEMMAQAAKMEGYSHLFTVVVAARDMEACLAEALESVVNQTVGFKHIQVIVVDDGSVDGTFNVAKLYESNYPGNAVALKLSGEGVSAARNEGLRRVSGKYINFLDADDRWASDVFLRVLAFFHRNPDIAFAACPYYYFGIRKGAHRLNYKFASTGIVDVTEQHDCPQLSASTCFFQEKVLQGRSFCNDLSVSEDTRLVNEILIDELRYGVIAGAKYYYRQRGGGSSAIATMRDNRTWYTETVNKCYMHLFDLSVRRFGRVLPFIQFTVMYDLQWRLRSTRPQCLSLDEIASYRKEIVKLLNDIDDVIISEQRTISADYVAYALALKHGMNYADFIDNMRIEGDWIVSSTNEPGSSSPLRVRPLETLSDSILVERVAYNGQKLVIKGRITAIRFAQQGISLQVTANNIDANIELFTLDRPQIDNPFGDYVPGMIGFACEMPLQEGHEVALRATLVLFGNYRRAARFVFEKGSNLPASSHEGDFAVVSGIQIRAITPFALSVLACPHASCQASADDVDEEKEAPVDLTQQYSELMKKLPRASFAKPAWTVTRE